MNAMECPLTCGCTASECDALTYGLVVRTTAHVHSVCDRHTMKPDSGDHIEVQVAPKVHHPSDSDGSGHGCPRKSQSTSEIKPIASDWQYDDRSAIGESHVEDMNAAVQPPPDSTTGTSSQEITETLNALVNDGSYIGTHQLYLIAPPKTTSEIIQLHTIEQKMFLRDLRSGKVKQICVLVAEDESVTDIRSAMVFAENERVLSSS